MIGCLQLKNTGSVFSISPTLHCLPKQKLRKQTVVHRLQVAKWTPTSVTQYKYAPFILWQCFQIRVQIMNIPPFSPRINEWKSFFPFTKRPWRYVLLSWNVARCHYYYYYYCCWVVPLKQCNDISHGDIFHCCLWHKPNALSNADPWPKEFTDVWLKVLFTGVKRGHGYYNVLRQLKQSHVEKH